MLQSSPPLNSVEANKVVVRTFYAALDAGVLDEALALLTPEYVVHLPGNPTPQDRDEYSRTAAEMYVAFPDLHHAIEDQLAEGDRVAVRLIASGTQRGPLNGMPPTGRTMSVGETAIFRLTDNRIAEQWPQVDTLGMLQQLGVIAGGAERSHA